MGQLRDEDDEQQRHENKLERTLSEDPLIYLVWLFISRCALILGVFSRQYRLQRRQASPRYPDTQGPAPRDDHIDPAAAFNEPKECLEAEFPKQRDRVEL
jgi:hypothetical protein